MTDTIHTQNRAARYLLLVHTQQEKAMSANTTRRAVLAGTATKRKARSLPLGYVCPVIKRVRGRRRVVAYAAGATPEIARAFAHKLELNDADRKGLRSRPRRSCLGLFASYG